MAFFAGHCINWLRTVACVVRFENVGALIRADCIAIKCCIRLSNPVDKRNKRLHCGVDSHDAVTSIIH